MQKHHGIADAERKNKVEIDFARSNVGLRQVHACVLTHIYY